MGFSNRLSWLLEENNTTWKEVSTLLKIGKNQRKLWEDKDTFPDGDTLAKLCKHFSVSADYLLGLDDCVESPKRGLNDVLTEDERMLIEAFRAADSKGRFKIIQVCMNELDAAEARRVQQDGKVSS